MILFLPTTLLELKKGVVHTFWIFLFIYISFIHIIFFVIAQAIFVFCEQIHKQKQVRQIVKFLLTLSVFPFSEGEIKHRQNSTYRSDKQLLMVSKHLLQEEPQREVTILDRVL